MDAAELTARVRELLHHFQWDTGYPSLEVETAEERFVVGLVPPELAELLNELDILVNSAEVD